MVEEVRNLEAKILSFRAKFAHEPWKNHPIINMIDEHFGITNGRFESKKNDYHISPFQLDIEGKLYKDKQK
jgi:hypothetical protein